ncbi:restriction endonuclease subunit S [Shewanella colwelliana]|uniref:restriction endonuclease subunit S n=1 Tax=Shewanella colwelliana TaxID=23 RepID=UPI0004B6F14B|nr:restriction endonuclease subunit S [Shewanella colwelliana]
MTGRYKAYPEYKESGVEWVGKIPSDWSMWKLAHAFNEIGSGTTPPTNNEEWFKGNVPWITTGELREKVIIDTKKKLSDSTLTTFPTLRKYPVGSVAIAMYGATIGRLGIFGVEATTNQACCVMTTSKQLDNKYLFYWLWAFKEDIIRLSSGGGQPNINQEKVASLKVSAPKPEEQQKIANFLDHETAKIDTLITKQEKLIELLKEKLLANRYHTVTKGLNPDVSFVETGISWTPLAPEHWSQVPNRSVMSMRRVLVGQNYRNYQLLSLTKKGVLVRNISSGEGKQSDHLDRTQEVRKGDLVFCLFDVEETPRTVGLSHHLGMISGDYTVFECSNPNMARFLEYFYKAMDDRKLLKPLYRGLRKRIPKPGFLRVNIPVPPKEELESILQSLDYLEERIEQLTHLADKQVTILKERKTALISAAVTGKIDVRNFNSKEQGSHNG